MEGKFRNALNMLINGLLYLGGGIIFVQAFWISYGVFMRYVMGNPDGMVTEATALMLVPLAFVGLSYACKEDAFPKVTIFTDMLTSKKKAYLDVANNILIVMISCFFMLAASKGFIKSYYSGAASEILLWPRFYFWFIVVVSLVSLFLSASVKLYDSLKINNRSQKVEINSQMELGD
ncbi:TRAP transporter small permease protein [Vibrio campbellii]|uniref:TRAP transporter small permease n=1 Tax=Vibrio campbellii TaxID=680 RepID=UPI0005EEC8C8|nr:TRAP transporter small permease [Vibrio campbellii]OQQ03461.1 TRAP transporter small permease protein [Vibrio campbellii]